jgi:GT2 family glycosyltransferase
MNSPSILIIIVTWNKKDYVLDLLHSLDKLDYPREALEVVVVDNASQDGTAEAIKKQYPAIHLLCNAENLGGTGGFNTGLAWAFQQPLDRYRYLWLLDNDVLVHRAALNELVALLESQSDIAIAGSTMMQLDYPWRINEMGAYLDRGLGQLVLNRHLEEIPLWRGINGVELLSMPADLSQQLMHCQPYMDVDYVAAASLLIRGEVAREAGLWRDYFIHFDDVEWCLRIRAQGGRVVVSARSLIWHLSAAAKVPTWVLYYDNRNILDLLKTHGATARDLQRIKTYILKKSVYYHLIGKSDLAQLHDAAISDFEQNRLGKKAISLDYAYQPNQKLIEVLMDSSIKTILISFTVDLQATKVQESFVRALLQRRDLTVYYLAVQGKRLPYQLPNAQFIGIAASRGRRLWHYWRMRGRYDLVVQSDYATLPLLSWLAKEIVFINDEGFCRRPKPNINAVWNAGWRWLRNRIGLG